MNFTQKKVDRYCSKWSSPPDKTLKELERKTNLTTLAPQMITGHVQGLLLQFIAQMIQPKSILEIGTFTGYSAICLAKGLAPEGKVYTIEINQERLPLIQEYISKSNMEEKIEVYIGDAKSIIPTLPHTFDLAFIDAAKQDYIDYFNLIKDKLKSGGFIIVDNVLWGGKVVDQEKDADTQSLHAFNQLVQKDSSFENVILPIRDGINLIRKI